MTNAMIETDKFEHAKENAKGWLASIEEMLTGLDAETDEVTNAYEAAMQTIYESVLSVLVRDGWHEPGVTSEGSEEYEILLSTGGPALRIWGKLSLYDEPETAELQMQDWFLPWTRYPAAEATLLQFAQCFYFGG